MRLSDDQKLKEQVGALLAHQPLRSAPASLEVRVLAAISQRTAAPWWQRSFMEWPAAARAGFFALSLTFAGLALVAGMWVMSALSSGPWTPVLTRATAWMQVPAQLAAAAADTCAAVLHAIPGEWLDAGAALGIVLYLTLLAAGAAAYRALYPQR